MGDGRSLPRTSLTFTDMADLVLLDDVLLRATGLSERQHLRRKVLRMKIRDAASRLDGKSGNPYWRVQDLRAERGDAEVSTARDGVPSGHRTAGRSGAPMPTDPGKGGTAPRVTLETVNAGHVLVDCQACGTVGVWPTRKQASVARTEHRCGEATSTPGVWSPADRAAPLLDHFGSTIASPE